VIGLHDRGNLKVGSWADLVVFDAAAEWNFAAKDSRSIVAEHAVRRGGDAGAGAGDDLRGRIVYRA
jgi:dihydroorotase